MAAHGLARNATQLIGQIFAPLAQVRRVHNPLLGRSSIAISATCPSKQMLANTRRNASGSRCPWGANASQVASQARNRVGVFPEDKLV
jgi:hypothetical protein